MTALEFRLDQQYVGPVRADRDLDRVLSLQGDRIAPPERRAGDTGIAGEDEGIEPERLGRLPTVLPAGGAG